MLLAMSTYLAHAFVPHHEHGIEICFKTDCMCTDDSHTHQSDHTANHAHSCTVQEQEVMIQIKQSKCSCGESLLHPHSFYLLAYVLYEPLEVQQEIVDISTIDAYSNLYASTYIPRTNGLRAPPASVVA